MSKARKLSGLLALAPLIVACGGDDAGPIDVGPTGPPAVRFVDPPSGKGAICVTVDDGPRSQIPMVVEVQELVLRPPGACGAFTQCGHLALFADGVPNNETAVPTIPLLLEKLGDPIHDGTIHQGTGERDVLRASVQVVDDAGDLLYDDDGFPLEDYVLLKTAPFCPDPDAPADPTGVDPDNQRPHS